LLPRAPLGRRLEPILILQGTKDEIIPVNSYETISEALIKSDNDNFKTILLEGASHSMYYVGESDFPYWSKLDPDYLTTIENWINTVSNKSNRCTSPPHN
jgi:dipeptidyl aminopeptidase/acylaminoacyl peptidase